jgi:hypothetical protein
MDVELSPTLGCNWEQKREQHVSNESLLTRVSVENQELFMVHCGEGWSWTNEVLILRTWFLSCGRGSGSIRIKGG